MARGLASLKRNRQDSNPEPAEPNRYSCWATDGSVCLALFRHDQSSTYDSLFPQPLQSIARCANPEPRTLGHRRVVNEVSGVEGHKEIDVVLHAGHNNRDIGRVGDDVFVFVDLVRPRIRYSIEPLATHLEISAVNGARVEFSSGSRRQILFALRPAATSLPHPASWLRGAAYADHSRPWWCPRGHIDYWRNAMDRSNTMLMRSSAFPPLVEHGRVDV